MNHKKGGIRSFPIVLFLLTVFLAVGFAKAPEKPEESTSIDIQKTIKETYKAAMRALGAQEFKIIKKKKNKYVEGEKVVLRIIRIRVSSNGNAAGEGKKLDYSAFIWLEPISEESTRVYIHVKEALYDLKFDQYPTLLETNRSTTQEQEIGEKLKQIAGVK